MRAKTDVIFIDKESLDFDTIRNARGLINYVDQKSKKGVSPVLIIDEVQEVQDWERAVAALLGGGNIRILVSGSNASLLSGELATRIAGRYLAFQVFPLNLEGYV
jgi:predicted AAA+ superfamily ATPase